MPRDMESAVSAQGLRSFAEDGFAVIPGLLSPGEVELYLQRLENIAKRTRSQAPPLGVGWTAPDGVTQHSEFWDLIFHERLLSVVRAILGNEVCFLQHTDLHVGFSSFNWHRDSVHRTLGIGPDWDESLAPYRIVRVGLYLHSSVSAFRLGLIPGTHRKSDARAIQSRAFIEKKAGWMSHMRRLVTGKVPDAPGAQWAPAAAGDAVIFDPRVLHTGTPVHGAKYSMFVAYGIPNHHFENHARYYRYVRTELQYTDIPNPLVERLALAKMYHAVSAEDVPTAATPSRLAALAMRNSRRK